MDFENDNLENENNNCFDNSNSNDNEYQPNDNAVMGGNIKLIRVILGFAIIATIVMNGIDIHEMYKAVDNSGVKQAFEENGIGEVEEIEFSLNVYDEDSWMTDYLNETFTYKP